MNPLDSLELAKRNFANGQGILQSEAGYSRGRPEMGAPSEEEENERGFFQDISSGIGAGIDRLQAGASGLVGSIVEAGGDEELSRYYERKMKNNLSEAQAAEKDMGIVGHVASIGTQILPSTAAMLLPGAQGAAAAGILGGLQTAGDIIVRGEEEGRDVTGGRAGLAAVGAGLTDMALSRVPLGKLVNALPIGSPGRKIADTAIRGAASGSQQQVASNLAVGAPWDENIGLAAAGGGVVGGSLGGLNAAYNFALNKGGQKAVTEARLIDEAPNNVKLNDTLRTNYFEHSNANEAFNERMNSNNIEDVHAAIDEKIGLDEQYGASTAFIRAQRQLDKTNTPITDAGYGFDLENISKTSNLGNAGENVNVSKEAQHKALKNNELASTTGFRSKKAQMAGETAESHRAEVKERGTKALREAQATFANNKNFVEDQQRALKSSGAFKQDTTLRDQYTDLVNDLKQLDTLMRNISEGRKEDLGESVSLVAKRVYKNAADLGLLNQLKGIEGGFDPLNDILAVDYMERMLVSEYPSFHQGSPNLAKERQRNIISVTDMAVAGFSVPALIAKKTVESATNNIGGYLRQRGMRGRKEGSAAMRKGLYQELAKRPEKPSKVAEEIINKDPDVAAEVVEKASDVLTPNQAASVVDTTTAAPEVTPDIAPTQKQDLESFEAAAKAGDLDTMAEVAERTIEAGGITPEPMQDVRQTNISGAVVNPQIKAAQREASVRAAEEAQLADQAAIRSEESMEIATREGRPYEDLQVLANIAARNREMADVKAAQAEQARLLAESDAQSAAEYEAILADEAAQAERASRVAATQNLRRRPTGPETEPTDVESLEDLASKNEAAQAVADLEEAEGIIQRAEEAEAMGIQVPQEFRRETSPVSPKRPEVKAAEEAADIAEDAAVRAEENVAIAQYEGRPKEDLQVLARLASKKRGDAILARQRADELASYEEADRAAAAQAQAEEARAAQVAATQDLSSAPRAAQPVEEPPKVITPKELANMTFRGAKEEPETLVEEPVLDEPTPESVVERFERKTSPVPSANELNRLRKARDEAKQEAAELDHDADNVVVQMEEAESRGDLEGAKALARMAAQKRRDADNAAKVLEEQEAELKEAERLAEADRKAKEAEKAEAEKAAKEESDRKRSEDTKSMSKSPEKESKTEEAEADEVVEEEPTPAPEPEEEPVAPIRERVPITNPLREKVAEIESKPLNNRTPKEVVEMRLAKAKLEKIDRSLNKLVEETREDKDFLENLMQDRGIDIDDDLFVKKMKNAVKDYRDGKEAEAKDKSQGVIDRLRERNSKLQERLKEKDSRLTPEQKLEAKIKRKEADLKKWNEANEAITPEISEEAMRRLGYGEGEDFNLQAVRKMQATILKEGSDESSSGSAGATKRTQADADTELKALANKLELGSEGSSIVERSLTGFKEISDAKFNAIANKLYTTLDKKVERLTKQAETEAKEISDHLAAYDAAMANAKSQEKKAKVKAMFDKINKRKEAEKAATDAELASAEKAKKEAQAVAAKLASEQEARDANAKAIQSTIDNINALNKQEETIRNRMKELEVPEENIERFIDDNFSQRTKPLTEAGMQGLYKTAGKTSKTVKQATEAEAAVEADAVAEIEELIASSDSDTVKGLLNTFVNDFSDLMIGSTNELEVMTKQLDAFQKAADKLTDKIGTANLKVAKVLKDVLQESSVMRKKYKDNPEFWLSFENYEKLQKAFQGNDSFSPYIGTLGRKLRASVFGDAARRESMLSQKEINRRIHESGDGDDTPPTPPSGGSKPKATIKKVTTASGKEVKVKQRKPTKEVKAETPKEPTVKKPKEVASKEASSSKPATKSKIDPEQTFYHGTFAEFDEFKPSEMTGGLIFFSPDESIAREYVTPGGRKNWTNQSRADEGRALNVLESKLSNTPNINNAKKEMNRLLKDSKLSEANKVKIGSLLSDPKANRGDLSKAFEEIRSDLSTGGHVKAVKIKANRVAGSPENPIHWREAESRARSGHYEREGFDAVYVTEPGKEGTSEWAVAVVNPKLISIQKETAKVDTGAMSGAVEAPKPTPKPVVKPKTKPKKVGTKTPPVTYDPIKNFESVVNLLKRDGDVKGLRKEVESRVAKAKEAGLPNISGIERELLEVSGVRDLEAKEEALKGGKTRPVVSEPTVNYSKMSDKYGVAVARGEMTSQEAADAYRIEEDAARKKAAADARAAKYPKVLLDLNDKGAIRMFNDLLKEGVERKDAIKMVKEEYS